METWASYDIIVLQETWLTELIQLPGFTVHQVDAVKTSNYGRAKGGLSVYISNNFNSESEEMSTTSNNIQIIKLKFASGHWVILFNIYAHPNAQEKLKTFKKLIQEIQEIIELRYNTPTWDIVITGDFNTHLIFTPEEDDQLTVENELWSIKHQTAHQWRKPNKVGKELVTTL